MNKYIPTILILTLCVCSRISYAQSILDAFVPDIQSSATRVDKTPPILPPSQVDLLMGTDSYVPPFYRGRALPGAGTNTKLESIVRFQQRNGSFVSPGDIIYTWKVDGRVLGSLSGRGRSSLVVPSPTLKDSMTVALSVRSLDNAFYGDTSITIPTEKPIVLLYQNNPLWGVMYYNALTTQNTIAANEVTFAAVPYFANAGYPNDPRLIYAWSINGSPIKSSALDPSELTINGSKSNGIARIGLELTHASNFFMDSKSEWGVQLSTDGNSVFDSPNGKIDPFSGTHQ